MRLLSRQKGMDSDVIVYADRGSSRIKKKYSALKENGKHSDVAKAACARELACYIWGMMTSNYDQNDVVTA